MFSVDLKPKKRHGPGLVETASPGAIQGLDQDWKLKGTQSPKKIKVAMGKLGKIGLIGWSVCQNYGMEWVFYDFHTNPHAKS